MPVVTKGTQKKPRTKYKDHTKHEIDPRNAKYNPTTIDILLQALHDGEGRLRAVKKAGIDYQTFLNWLRDKRKLEFVELVKNAEESGRQNAEHLCIAVILGDKSWQSKAWWLERNIPERYAQKIKNDVNQTGAVEVTVKFDDED